MKSKMCWMWVVVLVGVVPMYAANEPLEVTQLRPASNACAMLSVAGSTAMQQPEDQPTTPEEWLDRCDANDNGRVTCAEARAKSCGAPIPVTSEHPLYQFMRDGDGDGQVCE